MRRFVHSSSKGLTEVTKTRSKDKILTVQFIHESVWDFFLVKQGYQRLWPDLDGRFVDYGHGVLRDRCLAEINDSIRSRTLTNPPQSTTQPPPRSSSQMKIDVSAHVSPNESLPKASLEEASNLRRSVSEEFPFLEYAVHHVLYHADAAESNAIKQEMFLKEFPLKHWIYLDSLFERHQIRRHTPSASLLYILAEKNLPSLIKHELRRVPNMDIQGERYYFPMFAACANGNRDAIMALLMQETKPQGDQDLALQLNHWREIKPERRRRPLSCAAEKGYEGIVKLLLDTGKVDVDSKDKVGGTLLSRAASNGHKAIVKLLLEMSNTDVDWKEVNGWTPLSRAASNGHEVVVKLLLETGNADIDSKDIYDGRRYRGRHRAGTWP